MIRLAIVLVVLLAQEHLVDNPEFALWKDCKAGSWVKHHTVTEIGAKKLESDRTITVKELTADKSTMEIVTSVVVDGKKTDTAAPNSVSAKRPLPMPVDPIPGDIVEQKGAGDETLEIGGQEIACHWTAVASKVCDFVSVTKTWIS